MAVNQPKITDDQVDNSWMLEVTNQLNSEEARINALLSRIEELESGTRTGSSSGVTGNLQLTNYVQLVQPNTLEYTFAGAGNLTSVPHQVFVGGLKLIEGVDYDPSDSVLGRVTLLRQPNLTDNPSDPMQQLMIELSIWSL